MGPRTHNLGTKWRWSASRPGTRWLGGWMASRVGLDVVYCPGQRSHYTDWATPLIAFTRTAIYWRHCTCNSPQDLFFGLAVCVVVLRMTTVGRAEL